MVNLQFIHLIITDITSVSYSESNPSYYQICYYELVIYIKIFES